MGLVVEPFIVLAIFLPAYFLVRDHISEWIILAGAFVFYVSMVKIIRKCLKGS